MILKPEKQHIMVLRTLTVLAAALLYDALAGPAARAQSPDESLVLSRIYDYAGAHGGAVEGFQTNLYVKHLYQTPHRNFTLWAIPSMYAIARGQRNFVSEQYSRLTFKENGRFDNRRQVYYTTIPHNQRPMPTLMEFAAPRLYDETLYGDHILSPFHRSNRQFYRYFTMWVDERYARLYFRPRYVSNTQLIHGQATVDSQTGRIIDTDMSGEFDMIRFKTITMQGDSGSRALLPKFCRTNVDFKFLGNHVTSSFEAAYDCPATLPDSVNVRGDRQLIDSVRPYGLSPEEQAIYDRRDSLRARRREADSVVVDTVVQQPVRRRRHNYLKEVGWDMLGEHLIRSLKTSSEAGYVRLSPIINPQYVSYSRRKGLSYRFKLGARYNFNEDLSLGMNTRFGYNFKQRKFYFSLPLRLDYAFQRRDAYAEVRWASGNRIYNSSVLDELRRQELPPERFEDKGLDLFDDWHVQVTNLLPMNGRLAVETGLVFHERNAVNRHQMNALGMPTQFRSFAPMVSVKTRPWRLGPLFTFDYERGLPGKSDYLTYERWEIDASLKQRLHSLKTLNVRLGTGFYTKRAKNFFMDYSNFRDENLPGGWDDDWSGNFQLLSSRLYNKSDYYVRGNISFETPLLAISMVPLGGRFIERERIYLSSLSIAHTKLYSEVGYGFTTRLVSIGVFASFLSTRLQQTGAKFTFELFRRW